MATNNINISPPYPLNPIPNPPPTFEDCTPRPEDIFLKVVISALVCPLSKKIFSDPVRLPCGHVFERAAVIEWYNNYAMKICPITLCQKPYDFLRDQEDADPLRKELAQSFNKTMHQPSERVTNKIYELYNGLGDFQEKQQIKEAIDLFCSGQLNQGIQRMNQISVRSANSHLYLPILNLMKMQMQSVSVQINHLIQQTGLPPVEQNQIQPFSAPIAGTGMPQSLSSPSLNRVESPQPGNFYLAPRSIQQENLPEPGAGNSQIQDSSTLVIGTKTGMSQSVLAPPGWYEMGMQPPISFNPQASMQKIQEDRENVTNSDEQFFILKIKTGTPTDVYNCICSNKNLNLEMVIDEEGNTPLLWMAKNRQRLKKFAEVLLKAGANPNAQNNQDQTALHLIAASQVDRKDSIVHLINMLVEWGTCIDSKDKQGQTASLVAQKNRKWGIAHALNSIQSLKRPLENASDLSKAKRSRSKPSSHSPLTSKNRETSENSDSEAREAENEEATNNLNLQVMGSAGTGNFYVAPRPIQRDNLLEPKAGNSQIQKFPSPPIIDTRTGMPQSVIAPSGSSGMGIQQPIPFNSQAFMEKIQENREGVNSEVISLTRDEQNFIQLIKGGKSFHKIKDIKKLINAKINVNMVIDEEGNTPLLWIAKTHQRPKIITEIFRKAGANPKAQNDQGQTALHLIAASQVNRKESIVDFINMLVEWGACIDSRDKQGQTAYQVAIKNGKPGIARYLNPIKSLKRPLENASDLSKAKRSRSEPSTHSPVTSKNRENSENSNSEAREAGNEETTNNFQTKNNEDSWEEDLEKLFPSTGIEGNGELFTDS